MQIKSASGYLRATTSSGADVDVHASWVDLTDAATTCNPDVDNTTITTATDTTIVAGTSGSTVCRRIKYVSLRNIDASAANDVTITHHDGTSAATIAKQTLNAGDSLQYTEANGWAYKQWSTYRTVYSLAADAGNTSVTPASVSGLITDSLPAGNYAFRYYLRYQTAATTTGIRFDVNFTGTVTSFVWNQYWVDNSATAATAAADQDAIGAAGQVLGAMGSRAKGTAGRGTTISVDSATTDMFMVIEGNMVVTVAGQLDLYSGTEIAASAATIMAGSMLVLHKG